MVCNFISFKILFLSNGISKTVAAPPSIIFPLLLEMPPFGCINCLSFQKTNAYQDRKSTRLNSIHANISYAVFCFKIKSGYLSIQFVLYSEQLAPTVALFLTRV